MDQYLFKNFEYRLKDELNIELSDTDAMFWKIVMDSIGDMVSFAVANQKDKKWD